MLRPRSLAIAGCLALIAPAVRSQSDSAPRPVALDEALALAAARSPELGARRAEVEEARGRLLTARTIPHNPELAVSVGRRDSLGSRSTDSSVELSQELELGGRRRHRRTAAESDLAAAEARLRRAEQVVAARVELAFAEAARVRDLLEIDVIDVELAESALSVSRKRLEAGAGTDIEVNLAVAARARAERRRHGRAATAEAARFVLAEAVGLPPDEAFEPAGGTSGEAPDVPLDTLLEMATARRGDLEALRRELDAAQARVRLARAEAAPDLRIGIFHETEGDDDEITGVTFGIEVPFLDRNRGGVIEARASEEGARFRTQALERSIEREVAESWVTLRAAKAAAASLEQDVVGSLEENLRLLRRSFEAGKIGVSEVLLFRREFLDAQRESAEATADVARARVLVAFATGSIALPPIAGDLEPRVDAEAKP